MEETITNDRCLNRIDEFSKLLAQREIEKICQEIVSRPTPMFKLGTKSFLFGLRCCYGN